MHGFYVITSKSRNVITQNILVYGAIELEINLREDLTIADLNTQMGLRGHIVDVTRPGCGDIRLDTPH